MIYLKRLIIPILIIASCKPSGLLTLEGSINNSLTEVSAAELSNTSDLIWVIEDSGNDNNLYGLNKKGEIVKSIGIKNSKNTDWEDLTSDSLGNIYIGDFGNNKHKRNHFKIYKISHEDLNKNVAVAETIEFTMPKEHHSKDFESFFLYKSNFYIFSKETKTFIVLKVPNKIGEHKAKLHSDYNLDGKHNRLTSADISDDGKIVVLLNHDKLWKITDFENDNFLAGTIKEKPFKHDSQKEGICFKTESSVFITDERSGSDGGNIYSFSLN